LRKNVYLFLIFKRNRKNDIMTAIAGMTPIISGICRIKCPIRAQIFPLIDGRAYPNAIKGMIKKGILFLSMVFTGFAVKGINVSYDTCHNNNSHKFYFNGLDDQRI